MKENQIKWPLRFLRLFCKPEYLEEIEGDLLERYDKISVQKQRSVVRIWLEVFKLIRPKILRSVLNSQNQSTPNMIKHNIKVSFRSFRRYKSSFFINYIGLVGGLTTALLIYLWVNHESSVDRFHEKNGQIFRLVSEHGGNETLLNTNASFAQELKEYIPEIEYVVNSAWGTLVSNLEFDGEVFSTQGEFGSDRFFELFSYPLLLGTPSTALREPNSIVLSESMALRLFGSTDVIGKPIQWRWYSMEEAVVITGIFKDIQKNSSEQFDYVLNYAVYEKLMGEHQRRGRNMRTYIKLAEGANAQAVNTKIYNHTRTAYPEFKGDPFFIIDFADYYLNNKYENGKPVGGRIEMVRLFIIIGVLVLIIACINFMNLSTARASLRLKEIGVRKTMGALRKSITSQYLIESCLISILAGLTAIGALFIILPLFEKFLDQPVHVNFELPVVLTFFGIIIFTGLISGSYPALYLSGFSPLKVMKESFIPSSKDHWLRKGMIVFQFGVSLVLIVAVIVIYQQMRYVQTKNLGYENEYIINFRTTGMSGSKQKAFLAEARNIPGVVNAAGISHALFGAQHSGANMTWRGKDPEQEVWFEYGEVGYGMLELLKLKPIEGRFFSRAFNEETDKIVINAATRELMEIENVIGEKFTVNETAYEIIGVTENFHFQSLHEPIKPTFFLLNRNNWYLKLALKIEPDHISETLSELDEVYSEFNPGFPFVYSFHDQDQAGIYKREVKINMLTKYAAGLAILISSMGLFGLVSFMTQRKSRELSIRKVLGASSKAIITAVSKDFVFPIVVASIAGVTIAAILLEKWLNEFAYRIDLEWWFFGGAILLMILIAILTSTSIIMKAVTANPVHVLKE
ncbi:MAG: ABC transporter permease [Bacteroidota bacterium]